MSARALFGRWVRSDRASTVVEFGLISPVLVMILVGIIAGGWALHCAASVRFALEQVGRALQLDSTLTQSQLQALVNSTLTGIADPNVTVALTVDTVGGASVAHATATYNTTLTIPMLPSYSINYQKTVDIPLAM